MKKEDSNKLDPAKTLSNWKAVQNKTSFLGSTATKFNPKVTAHRQDSVASKSDDIHGDLIQRNGGNEDLNQRITRFSSKIEKTSVVDQFKRLMQLSDSYVRGVIQLASSLTASKSQVSGIPVSPNVSYGLNRLPTNSNQIRENTGTLDRDPQQAAIEEIYGSLVIFFESSENVSIVNNNYHSMEMLLERNPENLSLKFDKAVKVYLFQLIAKNQVQLYLGLDQVIKKENFQPYFPTRKMFKEKLEGPSKIFKSDSKDYIDELSLANFLEQFLDIVVPDSFDKIKNKTVRGELIPSGFKVLSDIVMLLEAERIHLKCFNYIICNAIRTDASKLDTDNAGLFKDFIVEGIRFQIMQFFKRVKVMVKILMTILTSSKSNSTREQLHAEMLLSNFRWLFQTMSTLFEAVENNDILRGISILRQFCLDMVTNLNFRSSSSLQVNSRYYEQTILKLTRNSLKQEAAKQEGDELDFEDEKQHQLLGRSNQILTKVKKELVIKGQYNKIDYKCQSFKSFISLIDSNQMFSELKYDRQDDESTQAASTTNVQDDLKNLGEDFVKQIQARLAGQTNPQRSIVIQEQYSEITEEYASNHRKTNPEVLLRRQTDLINNFTDDRLVEMMAHASSNEKVRKVTFHQGQEK